MRSHKYWGITFILLESLLPPLKNQTSVYSPTLIKEKIEDYAGRPATTGRGRGFPAPSSSQSPIGALKSPYATDIVQKWVQ